MVPAANGREGESSGHLGWLCRLSDKPRQFRRGPGESRPYRVRPPSSRSSRSREAPPTVSRRPRLHTLRHLLCEACSNAGRLPPPANTKSVMPIARSAARNEPTSSCVTSPAQRMRSVRVPALPHGARLPRSAAASRSTRCSHRAGASSMRLVSRLPLCSPNFCSTAGGRGTGRLCPRIYLHGSRLRATAKTLAEGAKREYAPEQEPKDAQASKVTLSQSSRRSPARNRNSSSSSTAR